MFDKIINIYAKFKSNNFVALFGFIVLIQNTYKLIISYIITLYDETLIDTSISAQEFSLTEIFLLTVVVAPLVETFIFQFLIIELLSKLKIKTGLILSVSTLLFSLSHNYNVIYIIAMVFPGLLYASFYLYLKKERSKFPFLIISSLHAISNLVAFILDDVFGSL